MAGVNLAALYSAAQPRFAPAPPPGTGFQLGPTGPLITPASPNFRLGPMGPLTTARGTVGAGPSGIWNVPTGLKPVLEAAPPTRFDLPVTQAPTYADLRASVLGPRPTYNTPTLPDYAPGTVNPNIASIPRGVAAPTELEMAALRNSGASALPSWTTGPAGESGLLQGLKSNALLRNTAPDAMAEGMSLAPALEGAAKYKALGKTVGGGLMRGLGGAAIMLGGQELANAMPEPARPGTRAVGNVAGAAFGLPAIGGAQAAGAAIPAVLGAEAFSRSAPGNEIINAGRNASTNPFANIAVQFNPLLQAEQVGFKLADLMGGGDGGINTDNRTNDTVFDIFGGDGGAPAQATPEQVQQRLAKSSPDALAKVTTDYGLDPAMSQKLLENYRKSVVLTQAQGGVPLKVGQDGKLADGTLATDKPGVQVITDEKGNKSYLSSDLGDIQEAVYTRSLQEIPLLAQQQSQEQDYMRKQALMQAQLEEAIPQYFGGTSWGADPTAQMLAAASIRDIPSRYVQAQGMQTQEGINSQIQQAQIQQMLAQQYPELFGRQSSSSPTTLDAAMAQ